MINIFGKKQKGFTLIELVVVISILGIMVLLATPKFIGYTQEAKLSQIKHDAKVVENIIDEYLITNDSLPETLQEFDYSTALDEGKVYNRNGLIKNLTGTYVDITNMEEVKAINSKLKGNFIANNTGDVYYVAAERVVEKEEEENDSVKVDTIPKEWLNTDYPKFDVIANSSYLFDESFIYSFGYNGFGQLGLGNTEYKPTPTLINTLQGKEIIKVLGQGNQLYVISRNGDVYAFGRNDYGQLGLGNNVHQLTPVKNEILSNFQSKNIKIVAEHSILIENGKLYVWGWNEYGQLGLEDYVDRNIPTENKYFLDNDITIKDAYVGQYHSFVTTTDNKLYSWGSNYYGQLGLGININKNIPTELMFFNGVPIKDIKTNWFSTFVLTEDGKLYSFGDNSNGQLGLGHTVNKNTPQLVNVDNKLVNKIIAGWNSIIAITTDGAIYGWGSNSYSLLGISGSKTKPIRLTHIEALNPVDIKMGEYHTVIKSQNGDIYTVGRNHFGQLGLGDYNNRNVPTKLDLSFLQ